MLGTVDRAQVVQLARLLATQDMAAVLDYARTLEQFSPDYLQMLDALVSLLARVALFQAAGRPYDEDDDVDPATMAELAGAIAAEDLQLYWQVGVLGRRDLPLASDARSAFALTLVRMLAFRPGVDGSAGEGAAPGGGARAMSGAVRTAAMPAQVAAAASAAPEAAQASAVAPLPLLPENWNAIIEALGLTGFARQLAANCALAGRQGSQVKLLIDPRAPRTASNEARIAEALSRYAGEKLKIVFEAAAGTGAATPARELQRQDDERLKQARVALESDPNIQALQRQMGATIFPESVRPNSTEEN
jgi:DNA polymerase-3 subunit gamma/tau